MGGENSTLMNVNVSKEEEEGLRKRQPYTSDLNGVNKLFHLKEFSFDSEEFQLRLCKLLMKMVDEQLHKSVDSPFLKLNEGEWKYLFYVFIHKGNSERLSFYCHLFESADRFFDAIVSLLWKEKNSEVVSLLKEWMEREEECFSSRLRGLEGEEKQKKLMYFFVETRIPRCLAILDSWMYHSFTGITLFNTFSCSPDSLELAMESMKSTKIVNILSLAIPTWNEFITEEEQLKEEKFEYLPNIFRSKKASGITWELIYCSQKDGNGISPFTKANYGYPTASLFLLETKSGGVFGGYIPTPWPRYEKDYFGDKRCFLVNIVPNLQVYSTRGIGKNFIRFPDKERRYEERLGIGFGGLKGHERIWIDGNDAFAKGTKQDMCSTFLPGHLGTEEDGDEFEISRIQLWGFNGKEGKRILEEGRLREDKFTERNKKLDRSAFFAEGQSITENPDKMIIDLVSTKRTQ